MEVILVSMVLSSISHKKVPEKSSAGFRVDSLQKHKSGYRPRVQLGRHGSPDHVQCRQSTLGTALGVATLLRASLVKPNPVIP